MTGMPYGSTYCNPQDKWGNPSNNIMGLLPLMPNNWNLFSGRLEKEGEKKRKHFMEGFRHEGKKVTEIQQNKKTKAKRTHTFNYTHSLSYCNRPWYMH